ncbi:MAG: ABC transporter ATP-binding protein [Acidobacteria bacterium]|nr:ABC transporter ATP-binding protein [Acidobacteriota bacterium]
MSDERIVFEGVSKFYGEVLGVNRVSLSLPPGITGLVGPNGAGKSTLMNLMTGLLRPTQGVIRVRGVSAADPERMYSQVGYCTQYDSFPPGITGRRMLVSSLRLHGRASGWAEAAAQRALARVKLTDAADRKIAAYSKGMRQRIQLALAIAHDPAVLVLDEPLNGLDPMARAEAIALFQEFAADGRHVIVSSHILHEVDMVSDQVVLLNEGYVVAEGRIRDVRGEMKGHPLQVAVRCDRPQLLASRVVADDSVVEIAMHEDRGGLLVRTEDAERFFLLLNRIVLESGIAIESVLPLDEDVNAVYGYLIGENKVN